MDRFEATIVRRQGDDGAEGVLIRTRPIRDNALENLLLNHFPSALEDGASEARIAVLSDGTLMANGVTNSHCSEIKRILLMGRNALFTQLEDLEAEKLLKKVASAAARNLLLFGEEIDFEDLDVQCPDCGPGEIIVRKLLALISEEEITKRKAVPGGYCTLPADFLADFNAGVPARFKELVWESVREMLPQIEEFAGKLPANIDKARRLIED